MQDTKTDGPVTSETFDTAAKAGALTLPMLHEAIGMTFDYGPDTVPHSLGLRWISDYTAEFLQLLQAAGVTVEEFFAEHLNHDSLAVNALNNRELLEAVAEPDRLEFVRQVVAKAGYLEHGWLPVARAVGITKAELAEMILDKLASAPIIAPNMASFATTSFLQGGGGRTQAGEFGQLQFADRATYWGILDDDQLVQALGNFVDRAPALLFAGEKFTRQTSTTLADLLQVRLGEQRVNQLLERAAARLDTLDHVSETSLDRLSFNTRYALARRVLLDSDNPRTSVIIKLAAEMEPIDGLELLEEFTAAFGRGYLASNYRAWRAIRRQDSFDETLERWIERRMRLALEQGGYIIGQIIAGEYRGKTQWQLKHGGITYVMGRHQRHYAGTEGGQPEEGDLVLVNLATSKELAPGLWATTFIHIESPKGNTTPA